MKQGMTRNVLYAEPFLSCKGCAKEFHVSQFYKLKCTKFTYYDIYCKGCRYDKVIEWRKRNTEKYKTQQKEYHATYKRKR